MRSAPRSTVWEIGVSLTTPPAIGRRLAERARGADRCVDARASAGGTPDHGAYLKGWRNASAALKGGTPNAIRPSDRTSWMTI
jgi:hypothetical protein